MNASMTVWNAMASFPGTPSAYEASRMRGARIISHHASFSVRSGSATSRASGQSR